LGGAGTGKTTVCQAAAIARAGEASSGQRVVVVAGSRRAAAGSRAAIAAQAPGQAARILVTTLHGLCFSLVTRFDQPQTAGERAVWLLTAARQDTHIRHLLAGQAPGAWPEPWESARRSPVFAAQVREVIGALERSGIPPQQVARQAERQGRAEWAALAEFFDLYLDVIALEGALDHGGLMERGIGLLEDAEAGEAVRAEIAWVLADDYQEMDATQRRLLEALAGPQRRITAFADPDHLVNTFRGVAMSLGFDLSSSALGEKSGAQSGRAGVGADSAVLTVSHRLPAAVAEAAARVEARLPVPGGMPAAVAREYRAIETRRPGSIDVLLAESAGDEAALIAHHLRQARLSGGLAWSEMAILVRSKGRLPALAQALAAAQIPVAVAGDEITLRAEPAPRALLAGLTIALAEGDSTWEMVERLLTSPLGGFDGVEWSRVRRRAAAENATEAFDLEAVAQALPPGTLRARLERVGAVIAEARRRGTSGASVGDLLWSLWSASHWQEDLLAAIARGGASARRASRDLDAVVALFDLAAVWADLPAPTGAAALVEAVEGRVVPEDLPRTAVDVADGVTLTTVHRAQGRQWPLVVVAQVQEGVWPALGSPHSLFDLSGLDPALDDPTPAERVVAERRLFALAVTRASHRLLVTAVENTTDQPEEPSRLIAELGLPLTRVPARPTAPVDAAGLAGALRRVCEDDATSPRLRQEAARRLAALAQWSDDRGAVVPSAHPQRWWWSRPLSGAGDDVAEQGGGDREPGLSLAPTPSREPTDDSLAIDASSAWGYPEGSAPPIRLSGSDVADLIACPRQWFLTRRARLRRDAGPAAAVGTLVHACVQERAEGTLSAEAARLRLLDRWDEFTFDSAWQARIAQERALSMLERYEAREAASRRDVVGVEVPFRRLTSAQGVAVEVVGRIDRIERDEAGRLRAVDFKTGRHVPSGPQTARHHQAAIYQWAILHGAVEGIGAEPPGGADLVFLAAEARTGSPLPKVATQDALGETPHLADEPSTSVLDDADVAAIGGQHDHPTWIDHQLAVGARIIARERFWALRGQACRWCAFTAGCPAYTGEGDTP
jgi:superfamily I DNA/RNA helicase/RecB family exonuclease